MFESAIKPKHNTSYLQPLMTNLKNYLAVLLAFSFYLSIGQDYIEYQKVFNRIDNDILENNLPLATKRLDTIHETYSFIYAKHCIKALQINCLQEDFDRANNWLEKCFIQGVPLWIVRNNEITAKMFHHSKTLSTIANYDSLNAVHNSRINKTIAKTIDSLYVIDQRKTKKINDGFILFRHALYGLQWLKNNRRQFLIIKQITEEYGFPGEKLIGLPNYIQDSSQYYKHLANYGPVLIDQRAYIMLIHYFSNPREDFNGILLNNVKKGYLPPSQFGAINDFMARWGKGKYGNFNYYNVWHTDPDTSNYSEINSRRQIVGLSSLEEQNRNSKLLIERRKNKTCNSTIILE